MLPIEKIMHSIIVVLIIGLVGSCATPGKCPEVKCPVCDDKGAGEGAVVSGTDGVIAQSPSANTMKKTLSKPKTKNEQSTRKLPPRDCQTVIRKCDDCTSRTLYLYGGDADKLLEQYLKEVKSKQGINPSKALKNLSVKFYRNDNLTTIAVVPEWTDRLTGSTTKEMYLDELKGKHAERVKNILETAKEEQADLVCGDAP